MGFSPCVNTSLRHHGGAERSAQENIQERKLWDVQQRCYLCFKDATVETVALLIVV